MSDFVIHSVVGSPYARAVMIALEEKGAAYRIVPLVPQTLRTPAHLALHPFGRVPVMDHQGFQLYESQALLRYVDRVIPLPPLTPQDPRAAARMDQVMNINDWYLFNGVSNVLGFQRIVGPRVMGLTPDETVIAAAMPKAHIVFDELGRLLGDASFFSGDTLGLADALLAPQMDFLEATPEWQPLTARHDNLRQWLERMNTRPSMAATTWERVAAKAKAEG